MMMEMLIIMMKMMCRMIIMIIRMELKYSGGVTYNDPDAHFFVQITGGSGAPLVCNNGNHLNAVKLAM